MTLIKWIKMEVNEHRLGVDMAVTTLASEIVGKFFLGFVYNGKDKLVFYFLANGAWIAEKTVGTEGRY